jgi:hypothetical protein
MRLNLPIIEQLANSQNILIAGAGGGFDIYIGRPLYFTLRSLGKTVHLANYSFCDFRLASIVSEPVVLIEGVLMGVCGSLKMPLSYFPEGYLAQWFKEEQNDEITVWMFAKTGVAPLAEGYARLTQHLGIDAIILVDGGVDSLMHGDEDWTGTLIEDAISISAVDTLPVPVKLLACLGFGTEVEERVDHYRVLENIATLAKNGAFLGSCALTPQMDVFQRFESACRFTWERPDHHKSHISTRIIPATRGEFGNHHMYNDDYLITLFISPLMSLYWFFDLNGVIQQSLIVKALRNTFTSEQAFRLYDIMEKNFKSRPRKQIPY